MSIAIPNRPVFRSQDVCEIVEVQPYVLRTWEAEFPDLGVAKAAGGPRVYRRADIERALRIKHLLFVDGLTMAGVRRRLGDEQPVVDAEPTIVDADVAALVDRETKKQLKSVRSGLEWILGLLAGDGASASDFELTPTVARSNGRAPKAKGTKAARAAKPPKATAKVVAKAAKGKAATKGAGKKGSKKR